MEEVGETKNGLGKEKLPELIKGSLESGGPGPGTVLLSEIKEGVGDIGEIRDKPMIEVGEAYKGTNILELLRGGQEQILSSFIGSIGSSSG